MNRNFYQPLFSNSNFLNPQIHTSLSPVNGQRNTRQSSVFRAVSTTAQPLSLTFTRVQYPEEIIDLRNEYNPSTSTFTPNVTGVYSLIASIYFSPNSPPFDQRYFLELMIRVIGYVVAADYEWIPGGDGVVTVSTIQRLQAGNTVEVLARSGKEGKINGFAPLSSVPGGGPAKTRFEGAKLD